MSSEETSPIPHVPGVYMLFYHTRCVYVGESKDLGQRIAGHEYREWTRLPGAHLLCFPDSDRKNTERKLIEKWCPLLNGEGRFRAYAAIREAQGSPCDWSPRYFREETAGELAKRQESMREYLSEVGLP